MVEYQLNDFALTLGAIISAARDLSTSDQLKQPICDDGFCLALGTSLEGLGILAKNFDADQSLVKQIDALSEALIKKTADRREAVLSAHLKVILEGVQTCLNTRKFMFIPSDQASYWMNPEMFGDDFMFGFRGPATHEMMEAGNCFASGRWTAAVFHCMRVAEHGLRRLAKKLRVTITSKGAHCPVEYGDWDTVITAIRNKILETRKLPRGPKRENQLRFYSACADHCEYMKDIWRNEVSHTRRRYNKAESLAVFNRVKEFMVPLAIPDAKREIRKMIKKRTQANGGNRLSALAQALSVPSTALTLASLRGTSDKK